MDYAASRRGHEAAPRRPRKQPPERLSPTTSPGRAQRVVALRGPDGL